MKKLFLCLIVVLLLAFKGKSQTSYTPLDSDVAIKMMKKYAALFKNHKETEGFIIDATALSNLLKEHPGASYALIFARKLKDQVDDEEKTRPTLLIKVKDTKGLYINSNKVVDGYVYYEVGSVSNLCPLPTNCNYD